MLHKKYSILLSIPIFFSFLLLSACGGNAAPAPLPTPIPETNNSAAVTQTEAEPAAVAGDSGNTATTDGYPAPDSGYVGAAPEGVQAEPPNPERQLPAADGGTAVIGGVLIRELVEQGGYLPLVPQKLMLGEIVNTTDGSPAYISVNDQDSPQAENFPNRHFHFPQYCPRNLRLSCRSWLYTISNQPARWFTTPSNG